MKRYKIFLLLIVFAIILIPIKTYAVNQVIDANEMEAFQKTKEEIQEVWNESQIDISADYNIYEEEQSLTAPYAGGVVKQEFLNKVQANLNYYRYLIGSPQITGTPKNCEDLQAATVLQTLSIRSGNALSHQLYNVFPVPEDMTEEFYVLGAFARHNIISSYNYKTPVYPFFNESYFTYVSGHRTALLSPTTNNVDWGLGNVVYGRISTSESNYDLMSNAIAAYPSPGYFPKQDFSSGSDWDIYLNANNFAILTDEEEENVVVTIKSLNKNETYTYTVADGNLYIGSNIIHIVQPPRDTYYDGDYEVYVTNLKSTNGEFVDLRYTVKFFDKYEGMESTISSVTYGNGLTGIYMDKEFSQKLLEKIIPTDITLKLESGSVVNAIVSGYNIISDTYQKIYNCIPIISDLPTYIKNAENFLENNGISVNVMQNENLYSYKYNQESYQVKEGESCTISMTYIGLNESYSNFEWYKVKDDVVEQLINGAKYQIDGTNLTITDFNEDDEAEYYVVNNVDIPFIVPGTSIYISNAIDVSLKPDYIKGDINNDGTVNMFDVNYGFIKLENGTLSTEEIERGDVTEDGIYNVFDINRVLIYLEGNIEEL